MVLSCVLIYWGVTQNNFLIATEYAFPEKSIVYSMNVSDSCEIVEGENWVYPLCENDNGSNDKCSVMNMCDNLKCYPGYYKCGLCSDSDVGCRTAIKYNFSWGYSCCMHSYEYEWCQQIMLLEKCTDTTKSNRHNSPSFRCPHYPSTDAMTYCDRRCFYYPSVSMRCFPEDMNCDNCKKYSQKVCALMRNYYYVINTRYGFIKDGKIYYTHKWITKNCSLNDTLCVTNEMNNTKTVTIYYDKNDPNSIIYTALDAPRIPDGGNLRVIFGMFFLMGFSCIIIEIFRKSKEHSEFLIDQQHKEIKQLNETLLESQLRPPDIGGIQFEASRTNFEKSASKLIQRVSSHQN